MITEKQKNLADWALKFALKNGCSDARITAYSGMDNSFEYRNNQLDKLEQSSESGMSFYLFVDGRFSYFSTNRLEKKELERFILHNIESTRCLEKDEFRRLPDPDRLFRGKAGDLELFDTNILEISVDEKLELLRNSVNEVYQTDDRLIAVSAAYSDGTDESFMIDSNGFEGESATTYFNLSAETSLKDKGHSRPSAHWYDVSIFWDQLQKKGIARKAYERTLNRLGQEKIRSGKYKMLVDNRNITRLLSPIIAALYGSSIQQKNSFLIDKLDEKIISEKITIIDNPHLKRARGAGWFDGEGVATKKMNVIEKGILKTYYINTYFAGKLKMMPTIQSPSVLLMDSGNKNREELLNTVEKGIWVTGFNGGNTNSSTGDFSLGIEGFLIKNGKVTIPVNEMNITGNLLSLWQNVNEVGNDPLLISSWRIPSVLFDDVCFNGK
ncbi:MAG: TldD/PmbA family protein [Dysgonamonadaceae bacterium]|jgi:PmbA protein|nr:TldD/PmbA family protein [Dysgonamonadaceae bacterium]